MAEEEAKGDVAPTVAADTATRTGDKRWDSVNHYFVLGVPTDFTEEELKKAYRKASRLVHPDRRGGSNVAFQRAADAYKTLEDEDLRAKYDEGGELKLEEVKVKRALRKVKEDARMRRMRARGGYGYGSGSYSAQQRMLEMMGGEYGHMFDDDDDDDDDKDDGDEKGDSEEDERSMKQSLKEEINRKYFPERFPWTPFSDPHEDRKKRSK